MEKLNIKEINKKRKKHPLLTDLPENLKDSKCFIKIERHIDNIMYSDHKHKTIKAFIKCYRCQRKFNKKRDYIKSLGFKDIEQYQMWKKVMGIIIQEKDFQIR